MYEGTYRLSHSKREGECCLTAPSGHDARLFALALLLALSCTTGLLLWHDVHPAPVAPVYASTLSPTQGSSSITAAAVSSQIAAASPPPTYTRAFSASEAYTLAADQCNLGPRVTGTKQGWATGDYIANKLKAAGWAVQEQQFSYRDTPVRNIIGSRGQGPVVLIGAHYDTRPHADKNPPGSQNEPIIGADDGASGVAVLLELSRVLDVSRTGKQVQLAFFDGEDRGELDGWPFAVGADYVAAHLSVKPEAMILLDMVGDQQQDFYWEGNSNVNLMKELWDVAAALGYRQEFIPDYKWSMDDDHIPFVKAGIPSVDIIDFDYPYWHTTQDTCDKLSADSLGRIGHVLQTWLERASQS
jgi:glutaminyl-peptide cyclotransferase